MYKQHKDQKNIRPEDKKMMLEIMEQLKKEQIQSEENSKKKKEKKPSAIGTKINKLKADFEKKKQEKKVKKIQI